jgi:ribonucleoside-diphosphate reductase alpha chain
VASPVGAITRTDITALEHLKLWKTYQDDYCEHKPSVTISVKQSEWPGVCGWTYENFESVSGISFLPFSDHTYKQAPYIECTEAEYLALSIRLPKELEWGTLSENQDETTASQELACIGGVCEI